MKKTQYSLIFQISKTFVKKIKIKQLIFIKLIT